MTQDLLFITKPTVTTKEAANLLGVTVQTILKKEKDGLIECVYKDNWKQFGSKIFYLEDIERLKNNVEIEGYSTKEAAEILNVAPSTVFTYIKSGKLPASKIERRGKKYISSIKMTLKLFNLLMKKLHQKSEKHSLLRFKTKIYIYINY